MRPKRVHRATARARCTQERPIRAPSPRQMSLLVSTRRPPESGRLFSVALAEPGGISISDAVHGAVRGRVKASFADRGLQQVKNIPHPVHAFFVYPDRGTTSAAVSRCGLASPGSAEGVAPNVAIPPTPSTAITPPPKTSDILPLPDKPSIAVLPFDNMSGDPEQAYFTDGVVEDVITALSRFKQLFLLARNSSFTYKGKSVDVKRIGRELGVRYVLEGSVRKAGDRVCITGQLIEAATGAHLWADRFDGHLADIFDLQDRVATSIVGALMPSLVDAEIARARRKPTESPRSVRLLLTRTLNRPRKVSRGKRCGAETFLQSNPTGSGIRPGTRSGYTMFRVSPGN